MSAAPRCCPAPALAPRWAQALGVEAKFSSLHFLCCLLPGPTRLRLPLLWVGHHHRNTAAAAAKSLQSCPTLCDPIDGSPLGSPVPGILQARTPEWVAISFSNAWKWKVKVRSLSCVRLLATPWTTAYQAPSSMGFSRQAYWSGVPLPSPRNTVNPPNWAERASVLFSL